MKNKEIDRIECAIRHIQTAVDVDPWAKDIAIEAMQKMLSDYQEVIPVEWIEKEAELLEGTAFSAIPLRIIIRKWREGNEGKSLS